MNSQILTNINSFIKKRLIELLGILLIITSIFLFLSIISYSPSDPNFIYLSENTEIKNIGGFYGSVISDFLLQSLGLISILLSFNYLVWGLKLVKEKTINIICGHFEGVDQRVIESRNIEEISIGDFILSGGETAAYVFIDAIVRLIPGVLGNSQSVLEESFENNLLEYPQYTKPQKWESKCVPNVLLSGDHAKIKDWRLSQSEAITRRRRPDLWKKYKKK